MVVQKDAEREMIPSIRPADLYYQYWFGFTHGAASRGIDRERWNHMHTEMARAYQDGFADGRNAREKAGKKAAKRYGYKPSILRLQKTESSPVGASRR